MRRLTKSRRGTDDQPDALRRRLSRVARESWLVDGPAAGPRALRGNGAPARCDRSGARAIHSIGRGRPMTVLAEPRATARDAAPRTRAERAALLEPLIAQRILVIDGAMGTLIQSYQLDEAGFRGPDRDSRTIRATCAATTICCSITQPEIVRRSTTPTSTRAPTSSRRTRSPRRRIAQADYGLRGHRPRDERGRGADRPRGRRRARGRRAGPAAVRRRRDRPHEPDRLDLAGRQRPGRPQRDVRRARRRLPGGRRGADRGRRRHPPHRDDLRHAQRQGRDLRRRGGATTRRASSCR